MWNIFYTLLILTTVLLIPSSDIFWLPKEMVFVTMGLSFWGASFLRDKNRSYKNKWIFLSLLYVVVSFIFSFYFPLLFSRGGKIIWCLWTIRPTINFIVGLLVLKTLIEYTDEPERWLKISKIISYIGLGIGVYSIFQFCGIDQLFSAKLRWFPEMSDLEGNGKAFVSYRMISTLGNQMLTGNLLAIISPICLIPREFKFKLIYILIFIAIILTHSSISLMAFIIGLMAYLYFRNRKLSRILIMVCFIGFILFLISNKEYFDFSNRLGLWKETLTKLNDFRPYTGYGLGNYAIQGYGSFADSQVKALHAHNEFIQILHDGGIIMLAFVIFFLIDLFNRIRYSEKSLMLIGLTAGLCSFLVISLAAFPLRIAPLALLGIIYIAGIENQIGG